MRAYSIRALPRSRTERTLLVLLPLVVAASAARAETWIVDWDGSADFTTIQAAINFAASGDTIVVAPSSGAPAGAYVENLVIANKGLTLRSAAPQNPATVAATVIDGGGLGRVLSFSGVLPAPTTIDGFTLRNGSATSGAGISFQDTSPTIRRCVIRDNRATGASMIVGGAISGSNSSALLRECEIVDNSISSTLDAFGCVGFLYGSPVIERCTIGGNSVQAANNVYAGGLYLFNSLARVTGCRIAGNTCIGGATAQGGGIGLSGNTAPRIASCTVADNVVSAPNSYGGGIRCVSGTKAALAHCTITRNTARVGGGLWCYGNGTSITVRDTLLWDNPTTAGAQFTLSLAAIARVAYSDVQGGPGAAFVDGGAHLAWEEGNIDLVPIFAAPAGVDANPATWEDNDYHLQPDSPCINRGDPDHVPPPGETDVDGDPRTLGCVTDMGSDESPYGVDGDLNGDGITDTADHELFTPCLTGPDGLATGDCTCADMDANGTADLRDFALLQIVFDPA